MANRKKSTARRRYWLLKSEPGVYSIDDFERERRTTWEGVRNYQARNLLRDEIRAGDGVLFYHSNAVPLAVVGVGEVVREGYPDHTAFDPDARYYDPKSDPDDPVWYMVDVAFVARLERPVTREAMLGEPALADMVLLQRGSRLSVQPVTARQWRKVLSMAGHPVDR
jgi:predicted RNA-binding protein with PUA-like domain